MTPVKPRCAECGHELEYVGDTWSCPNCGDVDEEEDDIFFPYEEEY